MSDNSGDNRPSVYYESDLLVFRASAFGNCDNELVRHGLGFTGEPPPAWLQAKFDEGNKGEDAVYKATLDAYGCKDLMGDELQVARYGAVQESTGQLETEYKVGRSVIRCHPDGLAQVYKAPINADYKTGERFAVEVKLLGKSSWDTYQREGLAGLFGYDWQMSIEMLTTGLPLLYGVALKDEGGNPALTDAGRMVLDVKLYREPLHSAQVIKKRLLTLTAAIRNDRQVECTKAQYPCPFYMHPNTLCGADWDKGNEKKAGIEAATDELSDDELLEIEGLALRYKKAKDTEKAAKAEASETSKELLALIGERDGLGRVTKHTGRSAGKYDAELAAADGVDLEKYKTPGREYTYVRVKGD